MKIRTLFVVIGIAALLFPACSINKMAINAVSNALTSTGSSSVFTGDSDPQLVGDALPFAIKIYEALLDANPKHQGLMFVTGSLFVMYANAYVQGPAEMLPSQDWQGREEGLDRAKQLYLRGNAILCNALNTKYPGFTEAASREDEFQTFLKKCKKEDVGLLYWAVAGGLAAYSINLMDFDLGVRIPEWSAMIMRAYELDPDYGGATLDEFLIIFYASLPAVLGGDKEKSKFHYELALEKTGGNSASAYISYAQSICVPADDYETYKDCLEKALAIDPDANISNRLVTIISQKKAQWLLDNAYLYFMSLPFPDDY
jgi:predicted anti-sigma-YlaC factor YlaD